MKIKRALSIISASVIIVGSATIIPSRAASFTVSDTVHLRDSLLGVGTLNEKDDVNNDGIVNIFDLCAARKLITASTGEISTADYSATEEYVKLIGRTCRTDDVTWLVQSGSAAEFTVSGTSASVTLAGNQGIDASEDYRPRFAVIVDGEIILDDTISTKSRTVELFSGTEKRKASVKVIHLSEANNGPIGIKSVTVTSDSAIPVAPVPKKNLNIEFIGDSITCAYGVEGASQYESFKTTTENFMKSYAYLTAEKLDADYSAVCYSGHGIISGYSNDGSINTDSLVPPYYEYVGKTGEFASCEWDFSSHKNDVVVINLGTNDSSYVSKDIDARGGDFTKGYTEFLKQVHECNPDAYIICTLGTMGCTDLCPLIDDAVSAFTEETGYERIMSYMSAVQDMTAGLGSDWHPNAVTQQNSAYVLADKICQALGMESDQLGLDVAADAEYSLYKDPDKGGNAAEYISDYDKSFWINMVSGGTGDDAIEGRISNIGIKQNGKYTFSFDCSTTAGEEIPVLIRSCSNPENIYFSDIFTGTGEKSHYEAEFESPVTDNSAEIVFQVGGTDSYNVTLYSIKLVKIG